MLEKDETNESKIKNSVKYLKPYFVKIKHYILHDRIISVSIWQIQDKLIARYINRDGICKMHKMQEMPIYTTSKCLYITNVTILMTQRHENSIFLNKKVFKYNEISNPNYQFTCNDSLSTRNEHKNHYRFSKSSLYIPVYHVWSVFTSTVDSAKTSPL